MVASTTYVAEHYTLIKGTYSVLDVKKLLSLVPISGHLKELVASISTEHPVAFKRLLGFCFYLVDVRFTAIFFIRTRLQRSSTIVYFIRCQNWGSWPSNISMAPKKYSCDHFGSSTTDKSTFDFNSTT